MRGVVRDIIDKYSLKFLEVSSKYLESMRVSEVSPKTLNAIMGLIIQSLNINSCVDTLRPFLPPLALDMLIPLLQPTDRDNHLWTHDPVQFIYSTLSKDDGFTGIKHTALQLIKSISKLSSADGPPMPAVILRYIQQYISTSENPRKPGEKMDNETYVCLLHVLNAIHDSIDDTSDEDIHTILLDVMGRMMNRICGHTIITSYIDYMILSILSLYNRYIDIKMYSSHITRYIYCDHVCIQYISLISLSDMMNSTDVSIEGNDEYKKIVDVCVYICDTVECDETIKCVENIMSVVSHHIGDGCATIIMKMIGKWWSGKRTGAPNDTDDDDDDKFPLRDVDGCMDSVHTIIKNTSISYEALEGVCDELWRVFRWSAVNRDLYGVESTINTVSLIISKTKRVSQTTITNYPLVCFLYTGPPPMNSPASLSQDDRILYDSMAWWRDSKPDVEVAVSLFSAFTRFAERSLGEYFHKETSYAAITVGVCHSLASEDQRGTFRLLFVLIENPQSGIEAFIGEVISLSARGGKSGSPRREEIILLSMLLFRFPQSTFGYLSNLGLWEAVFSTYRRFEMDGASRFGSWWYVLGLSASLAHVEQSREVAGEALEKLVGLCRESMGGAAIEEMEEEGGDSDSDSDYNEEDEVFDSDSHRSLVYEADLLGAVVSARDRNPEAWGLLSSETRGDFERMREEEREG